LVAGDVTLTRCSLSELRRQNAELMKQLEEKNQELERLKDSEHDKTTEMQDESLAETELEKKVRQLYTCLLKK